MPVWNRPEETKECIDSVRRCTRHPYRLIIIDNASSAETRGYLEGLKKPGDINITLVRNKTNEGFIKAVNKGIGLSGSEYVCILNNDTVVTDGWLGEMVKVFDKDPLIGIVNPSSNTLGQKLPVGVTPEEASKEAKAESGIFVELGSAFGFCMLVKRKLFDEVGLFDEIYGMGNYEDTDFSLRAKEKGHKIARAVSSYVYHRESASFNLLGSFKKDFEKNRRMFESKWGRTKRIIAVCKNINAGTLESLKGVLNEYAKEKSWAYVISPFFDTGIFFRCHSNLTFYHYGRFFYIAAFLKILFKKKKPGIVYCDSRRFSGFLKAFKLFHNAEVRMLGEAI